MTIQMQMCEVQSSGQKDIQVSQTLEPGVCHILNFYIPLVTTNSGNMIAHYSD